MTFYHQTLYEATYISHVTVGNFLNEEKEDIVTCSGRVLKLQRFQPHYAQIQTLMSLDIYDNIFALGKFRRKEEFKDLILITADRGTLIILVANAEKMAFERLIQEDLKIDTPRRLPLHYLAIDPQGHFFCTAALETVMKFWNFYGEDRSELAHLDFSVDNTAIYDVTFVDDNSENLTVAYLGASYETVSGTRPKCRLVFFDISRDREIGEENTKFIDHANLLISVPGVKGVLVCSENYLTYYPVDPTKEEDIVYCSIPKRITDCQANVIFVCFTKYDEKTDPDVLNEPSTSDASSTQNNEKSIFYFAQTEQGDIFKIEIVVSEHKVEKIILYYFITLPVATALCVLEGEFLFVISEFRDHCVYKIADIEKHAWAHGYFTSSMNFPRGTYNFFVHRTSDIVPVSKIESKSPIMQMALSPLSAQKYQWCLASGRGPLSQLTISERDVIYQFRAAIQKEKNERPVCMWVVESIPSISQEEETLIVISFLKSTAVYTLKKNTGFFRRREEKEVLLTLTSNTIHCAKIAEDAIIQVCPEGVCTVTHKQLFLVIPAIGNNILACTMDHKCVILAFSDGFLEHHVFDEHGCVKNSVIPRWGVNGTVTCLLLSASSEGDQLLAVGLCTSLPATRNRIFYEVHLFNVSEDEVIFLCKLRVESSPYSFCFMGLDPDQASFLVGCQNGKVFTMVLEKAVEDCQLNIIKTEPIGTRPVLLLQVYDADGKESVLAKSDDSWCKESVYEDFFQIRAELSRCICFVPEFQSIATISDNLLRVIEVRYMNHKPVRNVPLGYTPKKLVTDPLSGNIFIIESDNNSYTEEVREKKKRELEMHIAAAENPNSTSRPPPVEKIPKSWASCIRVVKALDGNVNEVVEISLKQRKAALSICYFKYKKYNLLLVGVAEDFDASSGCCTEGAIKIFRIFEDGRMIKFLYEKIIESAPLAMCCYDKYVLIGSGRKLALYSVTRKALELVYEKEECVYQSITAIYPVDERIWVNDVKRGMSCLLYESKKTFIHIKGKKEETMKTALFLLGKNIAPNEVVAACVLSGDRMIRATKSGTIFIVQLGTLQARKNSKASRNNRPTMELPHLQSDAPRILIRNGIGVILSEEKLLACFYLGDIVSSIQPFKFSSHLYETAVYTTLSGSIGVISELKLETDASLVTSVYESMLTLIKRMERKNTHFLSSHSEFRSKYYQCQNVIDGDYLAHFVKLDSDLQYCVRCEVGVSRYEIGAKIESIRRQCLLDFPF